MNFVNNWKNFSKWVNTLDNNSRIESSMWQNMIKDFRLHQNGKFPLDLRKFIFLENNFRDYGFVQNNQNNKTLKRKFEYNIRKMNYFIVRVLNFFKTKLYSQLYHGATELVGYPVAERVLGELSLLEGYNKFCKKNDFIPHGFNSMKSYYLASYVNKQMVGEVNNKNILEIGAGLGNFASILMDMNNVNQYVIVDLPEMIQNSSISIHALYPDLPLYFIYPGSEIKHDPNKKAVYFCVPEMLDKINSNTFDSAINIDSFQEMNEGQVNTYLEFVQRVVKHDGIFTNLNRRKFLEVENFDNNPLLYNYHFKNTILTWECDKFMWKTLNYLNHRKDPWMLRTETIKKN